MNFCCPTYEYSCFYGNAPRQFTKTCENYWMDGQEQTVVIPENTIFVGTCRQQANDLALELAKYRAQALASCNTCCSRAICVDIVPPEDVQYLDYFTASLGVRFSQDVTIQITQLQNCPAPELGFFTTFLSTTPGGGGGIVGNGQIKLNGGIIYQFGVGTNVISMGLPEIFTLGWDCETECNPRMRSDSITSFPAGIAQCPVPE